MRTKLYVVAASHPCWAVGLALEHKGLQFKRIEWPPTMHVPIQWLRFRKGTVPGLVFDGEEVVGSRRISDASTQADLEALPGHLDQIEGGSRRACSDRMRRTPQISRSARASRSCAPARISGR